MLTTYHSLNNALATQLTNAACDYAAQQGLNICVWILDHAGHPLAFQRMPGAPLHSIQIAQDKAYTAVSFGFATHLWQQRVQDKPALRDALSQQPRLLMFGGGFPLLVDKECIGAVGISGASEQQDIECAEHALRFFEDAIQPYR